MANLTKTLTNGKIIPLVTPKSDLDIPSRLPGGKYEQVVVEPPKVGLVASFSIVVQYAPASAYWHRGWVSPNNESGLGWDVLGSMSVIEKPANLTMYAFAQVTGNGVGSLYATFNRYLGNDVKRLVVTTADRRKYTFTTAFDTLPSTGGKYRLKIDRAEGSLPLQPQDDGTTVIVDFYKD